MSWRKCGLVYAPSGELGWARSHALLPTAEVLDNARIRIYYAGLDERRMGRIGYVDVDAHDPRRIVEVGKEPVLDLGEAGTFDDSGVNPSCLVRVGEESYLYYVGWQRGERVPYALFTGLAARGDGPTFRRAQRTPILDRTDAEPFLRSAPTILREGDVLRAWYVSGLGWTTVAGRPYPQYVIRHATSPDGRQWTADAHRCIDFSHDDEFGLGRPWVIREGPGYKMWYSIRSRAVPYRIGYAESGDGVHWTRRDDRVGIEASDAGWDSEMICYPCVVDVGPARYLFYNGNRHGATGFGCATWES